MQDQVLSAVSGFDDGMQQFIPLCFQMAKQQNQCFFALSIIKCLPCGGCLLVGVKTAATDVFIILA